MRAFPFLKTIQYYRDHLWRIREAELPRTRALLLRLLRMVVLSADGFLKDGCQLRASALTFYSLLSIVPILAVVFGIAKGFGFEAALRSQLMQYLEGQEDVLERAISFSHALIETTQGGLIAGIGLIFLFWAIIKMISNIEAAFNTIWSLPSGRSFGRKVSDYLSLMLICPLLFVIASALTVFIESQIRILAEHITLLGPVNPFIFKTLRLLPFVVIWFLFTFLYAFLPNTRVKTVSAAVGGFLGAAFYQIFQWIYITFQINVAKYNAIYGSFAALPLFLFWLQISWILVLLGAEIAYAHQHVKNSEFGPDCRRMPIAFRKLLALAIMHTLVKHFPTHDKRWNMERIALKLETPMRCVQEVLGDLLEADLITERVGDRKSAPTYMPARDPAILTVSYVLNRLEDNGARDLPVSESPDTLRIQSILKSFRDLVQKSDADVLLKQL
ncbi:putative ribonuclease BN [uncultured Desulfatiglans sp.]|uniref:Putative ribonuclease BN n=1 Tax=Uncultured Desulfatiglans sp. TaxID=1748965 RepID=A0A653AHV6_UNCDX|nr:putative ribonuclease BN [uncultured Desulfatiglans sp.]